MAMMFGGGVIGMLTLGDYSGVHIFKNILMTQELLILIGQLRKCIVSECVCVCMHACLHIWGGSVGSIGMHV